MTRMYVKLKEYSEGQLPNSWQRELQGSLGETGGQVKRPLALTVMFYFLTKEKKEENVNGY